LPSDRLAEGDVALLAGRPEHAERHRVDGDDEQRAVLLGGGAERLDVLDRAEEVGALQEDGGGLAVDRPGQRGGVGDAALQPDLLDLGAEALRVGGQGLAAVRVDAARDDEAAPAGAPAGAPGAAEAPRRDPRRAGVGDGQRGQSDIAVWNSNIACSPPEISGW
jgi:hypothetical protein